MMRANIVRIGNSKGIRLPKSILEQCHLKDTVELEVEGNVLTIRPIQEHRVNWSEAFSTMTKNQDDELLDTDSASATEWGKTEWQW